MKMMLSIFCSNLLLATIYLLAFQSQVFAQESSHEYAVLARERVEASLKPGATKGDLGLAEGSLTALGWFVVYGNDDASVAKAQKLNNVPVALYNGTDKMQLIYMDFTSDAYGEMLNLSRFDNNKPVSPSVALTEYAKSQVEKAIEDGANSDDRTLIEAEGSLMGLGWLVAYGNKNTSLSDQMEATASKIANEVYSIHNRGYQIMRNFHYWEMDKVSTASKKERFMDLKNGQVEDYTTGLVWMKKPDFDAMTWSEAMTMVAAMNNGYPAGTWRLPTNEEWKSMVPSSKEASSLFSVDWNSRYWSSSAPVNEYGAYHIAISGNGGVDFDSRTKLRGIWPVRSANP